MKNIQAEVIAKDSREDLIDAIERYMRAGWKPILDPEYGVFDEPNSDGTITRRPQYFQRVIKVA